MKWPWVSRDRLAEVHAWHRDVVHVMEDRIRDLRAANEALLDVIRARQVPATVATPVIELLPKQPDPVTVVIREQAGDDHALAAHLRRYASDLKRQGASPDEIVGKLVQWQTSEPFDEAAQA